MTAIRFHRWALALIAALGLAGAAQAQLVINDTLTGATSAYKWVPLNGACLTAGYAGALNPDGSSSSIPPCVGLPYYSGKTLVGGATGVLPDAVGSGALRLTNGATDTGGNGNSQSGAIVSNFTFPTTQGIQVTWSTRTYGGNAYNNAAGVASGADGIGFFLADGSSAATVGALGGSLGYSCSNGNATYDGVLNGYLGIGMDEFGNFSNSNDNTNTPSGGNRQPGYIAVRGAGHTRWDWLNQHYPTYYPSSLNAASQAAAVKATCANGSIMNYSGGTVYYGPSSFFYPFGTPYSQGAVLPIPLDYNYPYIPGGKPFSGPIFNQEAFGTTTTGGVTSSKAVRGNAIKVTYQLTITQTGLMDLYYSLGPGTPVPVFSKLKITDSNGPLPASFRFGFSSGTGSGSNVHEITCFKAAPANVSGSTAGSNVLSSQVKSGNQLYLAYYHQINSWGSLTAQNLSFANGVLSVSSTVNWDAGCMLTGGACDALPKDAAGNSQVVTAPLTNATRTILSWNGGSPIAFKMANLSQAEKNAITANDGNNTNSNRVDYLRGLRSMEVANGGAFRNRSSLLGDIWGSSPVWVGPPTSPYSATWADLRWPTKTAPEGATYASFIASKAARTNVVYVGSNDGMLHGFRTGSYDATGTFVGTVNDGKEVLAYVPSQVISSIHPVDSGGATVAALDYSHPLYAHNFFVDAAPGQGDLFYGGAWHTWLVGGLGAGGQPAGPINNLTTVGIGTIYGLDITDPTAFSEANPSATVIGELNSTTLTGTGLCSLTNCGDYLGMTYGTPLIRRLHDGKWAILFGNGYNSKKDTAGLFIAHVDPTTGGITSVQFLDTKTAGAGATLNGIGQVTAVDLDGDHITDYVYAGDVLGNLWRFDLSDTDSTKWSAGAKPIFTTQSGQPISAGVAVDVLTTTDQNGGTSTAPKVIVAFGTGQQLPQTLTAAPIYPTTMQSLYGIWDADMSGWNAKASTQLASMPTSSIPTIVPGSGSVGSAAGLLVHSLGGITTSSSGALQSRAIVNDSSVTVCWWGTTACTSAPNNQMGWEMDLAVQPATSTDPQTAEQAFYTPFILSDVFNINTMLPTTTPQTLTCDGAAATGYSIGISMATGGATAGGYFSGYTSSTVAVPSLATGTSTVVTASDGSTWLVYQKNDGSGGTTPVNVTKKTTSTGARLTWTKLR